MLKVLCLFNKPQSFFSLFLILFFKIPPGQESTMLGSDKGVICSTCRSQTAIHPNQHCDMRSTHSDINQHPTINVLLYVFRYSNLILQHLNLPAPPAHINDLRGKTRNIRQIVCERYPHPSEIFNKAMSARSCAYDRIIINFHIIRILESETA